MSNQQSTSPADPPRPPKARVGGGLDLSSRLYATSMLSGPLTDAAPNSVRNLLLRPFVYIQANLVHYPLIPFPLSVEEFASKEDGSVGIVK